MGSSIWGQKSWEIHTLIWEQSYQERGRMWVSLLCSQKLFLTRYGFRRYPRYWTASSPSHTKYLSGPKYSGHSYKTKGISLQCQESAQTTSSPWCIKTPQQTGDTLRKGIMVEWNFPFLPLPPFNFLLILYGFHKGFCLLPQTPRAEDQILHLLDKHSTTELNLQPVKWDFLKLLIN